jgi:hypothetical protein
MIGIAAGVDVNTAFRYSGIKLGNQPMVSPVGVIRVTRHSNELFSMGLRIEASQQRSREKAAFYDNIGQPIATGYAIYNMGKMVLSFSPFLRWNIGMGKTQGLIGVFAGYARAVGSGSARPSLGEVNVYFKSGSGFVSGIEGGFSHRLGDSYSLEVLACAQYAGMFPGAATKPVTSFAFPVTVGIAKSF